MGLQETLKFLAKEHASAFEMDTTLEGISTGSIAVDMLTGIGGFPRRRISEVFGWESSGKTTLCLMACAQCERDGLKWAYLDVERGVDLHYAAKLGMSYEDQKKGVYATPRSFEECATFIVELIRCGEIDLVVTDSVPGMIPENQIEGDINEEGPIAARARKLASFLPKLAPIVDEYNVAMVFTNQMRMRPATSKFDFGPKEQTSGGSALRFFSSLRIDMTQKRRGNITRKWSHPLTGKETDVPVASLHSAEAFKNKIALPYRDVEFLIRYDEENNVYGIDNLQTIIDIATARGIIEPKGAWFAYKGTVGDPESNFRVQGKEGLYSHLAQHPNVVVALQQEINPQETAA